MSISSKLVTVLAALVTLGLIGASQEASASSTDDSPTHVAANAHEAVRTDNYAAQKEKMKVTFTGGPGDYSGSVWVTNAATGKTSVRSLPAHTSPSGCATTLAFAASDVGVPAAQSGESVTLTGKGTVVTVVMATISASDVEEAPQKTKAECEACCRYHRDAGNRSCRDANCINGVQNFYQDVCLPRCGENPNSCQ